MRLIKFGKLCVYTVIVLTVYILSFVSQRPKNINEFTGNTKEEMTGKSVVIATAENVMSQRRDILREHCPKEKPQPDPNLGLLVSDKYKVLFCDIAKIGSTFLKKMWYILENNLTETDPMTINNQFLSIHTVQFSRLSNFNFTERKKRIDSYTKVIFTRNPYSRLYSAYQNKFVTVNPDYWTKARKFIKRRRKNPQGRSVICGHDLTFEEFLLFVLDHPQTVKYMDDHWKPMVSYCDPCAIDYDIIGKIEAFNEDLQYFLCNINAEEKIDLPVVNPLIVRKNNIKWEVSDSLDKIKRMIRNCIPKSEVAYRVVQNMVSHGYIEPIDKVYFRDFPFEYTKQDLEEFIYRHMNKSSTEKLLHLPQMVRDKAFLNVSSSVLNRIKKLYEQDFRLFNYNLSEY